MEEEYPTHVTDTYILFEVFFHGLMGVAASSESHYDKVKSVHQYIKSRLNVFKKHLPETIQNDWDRFDLYVRMKLNRKNPKLRIKEFDNKTIIEMFNSIVHAMMKSYIEHLQVK